MPYVDTAALELILVIGSVWWGLWLLVPWAFCGPSEIRFLHHLTSRVGPVDVEAVFGVVALVIGVMRLIACLRDRWVIPVAIAGSGWWVFILFLCALVDWRSTGIPVYGTLAVANLLIVFRSTASR